MPRRLPPSRINTGRFEDSDHHDEPPTPPPKDPDYVPRVPRTYARSRRPSTMSRSSSHARPPVSRYSSYNDYDGDPLTPGIPRQPSAITVRPGGDIPALPSKPYQPRRHVVNGPASPRLRSKRSREARRRMRGPASPTSPTFASMAEPSAAVTAVFGDAIAAGNRALQFAAFMNMSEDGTAGGRIIDKPLPKLCPENMDMTQSLAEIAIGANTEDFQRAEKEPFPEPMNTPKAMDVYELTARNAVGPTGTNIELVGEENAEYVKASIVEISVHPPSEPQSEIDGEESEDNIEAESDDENDDNNGNEVEKSSNPTSTTLKSTAETATVGDLIGVPEYAESHMALEKDPTPEAPPTEGSVDDLEKPTAAESPAQEVFRDGVDADDSASISVSDTSDKKAAVKNTLQTLTVHEQTGADVEQTLDAVTEPPMIDETSHVLVESPTKLSESSDASFMAEMEITDQDCATDAVPNAAEDDGTDSDRSSACSSLLPKQEGGKSTRSSSLTMGDYPKSGLLSLAVNGRSAPASIHSSSETANSANDETITALPSLLQRRSRRSSCSSLPDKGASGWGAPTPVALLPATAAMHRHVSPTEEEEEEAEDDELDLTLTMPGDDDPPSVLAAAHMLNSPASPTIRRQPRQLQKTKRLTKSSPHLRLDSTTPATVVITGKPLKNPRTPRLPSLPSIFKKSRNLLSPPPPPMPPAPTPPALKRISMHAPSNSNASNLSSSNATPFGLGNMNVHPLGPSINALSTGPLGPAYSYSVTCTSDGRPGQKRKGSKSTHHASASSGSSRRLPPPSQYTPGLKPWDEDAFRRWEAEDMASSGGSGRKSSLGGLLRRGQSVRRDNSVGKEKERERANNDNSPMLSSRKNSPTGDHPNPDHIIVEHDLEVEHRERGASLDDPELPMEVFSPYASRSASRIGIS